MPATKIKPSDIAAEAKKQYIPYIKKNLTTYPAHSWLVADSSGMRCPPTAQQQRCRMSVFQPSDDSIIVDRIIAVIEGDPADVALDLAVTLGKVGMVALVNMANEKRAGGDWEAGWWLDAILHL